MDPRGAEPPREFQGLNPRLDTLDGKTVIVVNLHGGNEDAIRSVGPALQAAVPACNVISMEVSGKSALTAGELEEVLACDAVIFGHDY
ncbi:hypothetical protein ES703_106896 [subsurface metagenome]